jgi:SAM-dependent methyltransferase
MPPRDYIGSVANPFDRRHPQRRYRNQRTPSSLHSAQMRTAKGLRLRIAGRLRLVSSIPVIEPRPGAIPPPPYSPALHFDDTTAVATRLIREQAKRVRRGTFLEVGGGPRLSGKGLRGPLKYISLDLVDGPETIVGDICSCPQVPDATFDVIYSTGVFEFVAEPWLAAGEIGRILKPGGLFVLNTCFAWRYHPGLNDGSQPDYWRYTHDGLRLIFEKYGQLQTLETGYDLVNRRVDMRGGKIENDLDAPPIDEFGGFRENWSVFYAARKPS